MHFRVWQPTISFLKWYQSSGLEYNLMKHIPSPCYDGLWCHFKGSTPTYNKFWFCVDDLTHCVGDTRKTYITNRSIVSTMTCASKEQVDLWWGDITRSWICSMQGMKVCSLKAFGNESSTLVSQSLDAIFWPKVYNDKNYLVANNVEAFNLIEKQVGNR